MIPSVCIEHARLAFGENVVFSDLKLTLPAGKWIALLGTSGVGKSSLLKSIAGLIPNAHLNVSVSNGLPLSSQLSYMAQSDLLLSWLPVLENILIGYKLRGKMSPQLRTEAVRLLEKVDLLSAMHHFPYQLSGGMRQRVALVRTLLENRPIVLMDEPFSALDTLTRFNIHATTLELLANKTVLFVTHDPLEALRLADEIYLLEPYPNSLRHVLSLKTDKPRALDSVEVLQNQKVLYECLI